MSSPLGFIGLGTMGRRLAGHLLSAGHSLLIRALELMANFEVARS
jgi:3-hydroxyisobutyrate dehydrogenase-like beta-hydroxyacid dehydrogenase